MLAKEPHLLKARKRDERQVSIEILRTFAINWAKKSDLDPPLLILNFLSLALSSNKASTPSASENAILSKKAKVISSVAVEWFKPMIAPLILLSLCEFARQKDKVKLANLQDLGICSLLKISNFLYFF